MNKKCDYKIVFVLLLALFSLFAFVGCTDDVEDTDEVTYIDFGRESASSRGIESWNESLYPPESLYWTYTAKKIRGNYTTGQTLAEETVLKNGPAPGLGTVGPFSVGVWEFKLYGYLSCTETTTGELEFSDLVYTGKTGTADNAYTTTIDKRPAGTPGVQEIIFELSTGEDSRAVTFWNNQTGVLELKDMYLTVPEGQRFTVDSATTPVTTYIRVTVTDVTVPTSPVKVAVSTTDVTGTAAKESGTRFDLNNFEFESAYSPVAKFDAGVRNLQFKAEYKDVFTSVAVDDDAPPQPQYTDGWAEIGTISTYPVPFTKGVKTTLSGDINDIKVDTDESAHKDNFTAAVVKILKTGKTGTEADAYDMFGSIAKAAEVYGNDDHEDSSGNANPIEVMRNIDNGGSVALTGDIVVKLNNFLISNLTVSGSGKVITFKLDDTNRDYKFGEGKLVNLTCIADTAYIQTDDGKLDVNALDDSVYHTGTADSVTITSVSKDAGKGYFLGTTKEGTSPITSVSALTLAAGNLDLGSYTAVGTLTVTPTSTSDATVKGRTTTEVGNINTIRDNSAYTGNIFKKVILNANGGTPATAVTKYGIEGMYMDLNFATAPFTAPASPTGLTFICWNTQTDRSGDDASGRVCVGSSDTNLYAVWGSPVAEIYNSTTKQYGYYGSLESAIKAYTSATNPIILLSNISGESFTPAVANAKVNTNGKTITNVTLSGTTAVDFMSTGGGSYKFSAGKINSLEIYAGGCAFNTAGTVDVNVSGETAVQSGTAVSITVTKGSLFMEGSTGTLDVKAGASVKCTEGATPVTTTGTRKYNGTALTAWYKSETSGADSVYKKITINGNGTSSTDKMLYFYAVEGEKVTLPAGKFIAPAGTSFSGWNTEVLLTGEAYADGEAFNAFAAKTLYAVWGDGFVAKIKNTSTGQYDFFPTMTLAIAASGTTGYSTNNIVLVKDVDGCSVTKAVTIALNGHSLKNATGFNGDFVILPFEGSTESYKINTKNVSTNKLMSFVYDYSDSTAYIETKGADLKICGVDGTDNIHRNVVHSGTAGTVTVECNENSILFDRGYHYKCTSGTKVMVLEGYADFEAGSNVTALWVGSTAEAVADNLKKVVLHGTTTSTIGNVGTLKTNTVIADTADQTAFRKIVLNRNGVECTSNDDKVYYAIEGVGIKLTAADKFVPANGAGVVSDDCWNQNSAGTSHSYGVTGVAIPQNGSLTLYAQWRKLVGGTIYYIDTSVTGVIYTFYKENGEVIMKDYTLANLKSEGAYSYKKIGSSTKDRYYVYNKDLTNPTPLAYTTQTNTQNDAMSLSYTGTDGKTYTLHELTRVKATQVGEDTTSLGKGKSNTAYFLNLRGTGYSMNPAYVTGNNKTFWYYLKNTVNNTALDNGTGCCDWYVPSGTEALYLVNYDSTVGDFGTGFCRIPTSTMGHMTDWGTSSGDVVRQTGNCALIYAYKSGHTPTEFYWLLYSRTNMNNTSTGGVHCSFIRSF